ncbi:uncharacterized protein LOC115885721 [Sitophilus oryzae]|uniref:Uncharacterized protein LOC115885721 n=1 Tax=Sitophilus oryzae TaxID=7048 RepID=A0A6J2YBJ2_SITOR|nr:uncharacterized protein LOC115885721 [Sitophilus oryzae]
MEQEGIDVALLQEPWRIGEKIAGLSSKQGKVLCTPRPIRPRACIIHSNRVDCTLIPVLCTDDVVTAILTLTTEEGEKRMVICSAYFPGDEAQCPPSIISDVLAFCLEKGIQLIIGCDANAHHTVWGGTNINTRGESVLNFTLSEGLLISNIGNKPTFVTRARKEVLDLTLCTGKVSDNITNWHVSDEPSCSDHRHIRFDLNIFPSEIKYRNPRDTNWIGFRMSLSRYLDGNTEQIKGVEALNSTVERVSEAIVMKTVQKKLRKTRVAIQSGGARA